MEGIVDARTSLKKGVCFKIGDGFSINSFDGPWVPGFISTMKDEIDLSLFRKVAMFKRDSEGGWNEEIVRKAFSMDSEEAILNLRWLNVECEDKLIWLPNSGKFSIKSSYKLIIRNTNVQNNLIWKNLWSLKIHDRLEIFLWRMLAKVIPSKESYGREN